MDKQRHQYYSKLLKIHLSRTQRTVFPGSPNLLKISLPNPSSCPSTNSIRTTLLFKTFKFGEFKKSTLCFFLISNSCEFGRSLSFRKASIAEINLHFFKYSWVSGITTSQMTVQPATKKGYRLKKSSIETRIDSMLILSETCSVSAANEGGEKNKDVKGANFLRWAPGKLKKEWIFSGGMSSLQDFWTCVGEGLGKWEVFCDEIW